MKRILFFICFFMISQGLWAVPTKLIVRAKAKDAKFIGSSIGGAQVIIRNKATGEILAQGLTQGSTGNTQLIMNTLKERGDKLSDDNTAKFMVELDLEEVVFIRVEVLAPASKKQATVSASTELWMIPGKHILGDGVVLEIPGFIVDVLKPRTHQFISLKALKEGIVQVQANVVMMCGCTISDGGIWDANKYEVRGVLKKEGENLGEINMKLVSPNLFEGEAEVSATGNYELVVYAYHAATGNTGVDKVNYVVRE